MIDDLTEILSNALQTKIANATYESRQLHGGTLGDVKLISAMATTADGELIPYKLVRKTQKKWERYGDPLSWRREYDLYQSDLNTAFSDSFRWPVCYHAAINAEEDEILVWMEYIEGVSGLDLSGQILEQAAESLGRFQGSLLSEQAEIQDQITNLSSVDYVKNLYLHYRSWPVVYDYIRSDDCDLPEHISRMLIDFDTNFEEIYERISKLPVVLCHKDFWVANIIATEDIISLIDWDTAGWGYFGEDLASLIADEADVEQMLTYYKRCVPAYYRGFSQYADLSRIEDDCIYELILLMFGYRLIESHLDTDDNQTSEAKMLPLQTLQKIYEIGQLKGKR